MAGITLGVPVATPVTENKEVQMKHFQVERASTSTPGYAHAVFTPVDADGNWDPEYGSVRATIVDDTADGGLQAASLLRGIMLRAVVADCAEARALQAVFPGVTLVGKSFQDAGALVMALLPAGSISWQR